MANIKVFPSSLIMFFVPFQKSNDITVLRKNNLKRAQRTRQYLQILLINTMFLVMFEHVQATIITVEYSGVFELILDSNGNIGSSFSPDVNIKIGDTFKGTYTIDTEKAIESPPHPLPNIKKYDFGLVSPTLLLNDINIPLRPKTGLSVGNKIDATLIPDTYFKRGIRESGFDPIPNLIDLMLFFTDLDGFDPATGNLEEIILFSFDPTSMSLVSFNIPDPFVLLDNAFFIYLETKGNFQAAGFGKINNITITSTSVPKHVIPVILQLLLF